MTWKTQLGDRHATGAEARLLREAIEYLHAAIELEIADPEVRWTFQVPVFDKLAPIPKLGLLADVGEALLSETEALPLTAITEGAVAAIYHAVRQLVTIEIDEQKEAIDTGISDLFQYRALVLEIANSIGPDGTETDNPEVDPEVVMPAPECTDFSEWEWLIEAISDRFLWDEDFLMADEMLDAPPDTAKRERRRLGITRGYYLDDAPDSERVDLATARKRLEKLVQGSNAG
jgi:hypothetical protein